MSLQQYATLTPDLSSVQSIDTWNSAEVSALQAAGNPKFTFLRVVNMTAQPAFDPTTQSVVQNGWTVTASDVEPVWQVISLSTAQQQWNTVLALKPRSSLHQRYQQLGKSDGSTEGHGAAQLGQVCAGSASQIRCEQLAGQSPTGIVNLV